MLIVTLSWCLVFIHPLSSAIQHCIIGPVDIEQSNSRCIYYTRFEFTPVDNRFMKIEILLMFPGAETCQTHTHESEGARPKLSNCTNVCETAKNSEGFQTSEYFISLCGILN